MQLLAGAGTTLALMVGLVLSSAHWRVTRASQPAPTLRLVASLGEGAYSWNDFLRGSVRVVPGTTVSWSVGSDEAHTVTFLAGRPRPDWIVPQPEPSWPPMINPIIAFPEVPSGAWDGTSFVHSGELARGQGSPSRSPGRGASTTSVCCTPPWPGP